jgi:hypothetical protein
MNDMSLIGDYLRHGVSQAIDRENVEMPVLVKWVRISTILNGIGPVRLPFVLPAGTPGYDSKSSTR